MKSETKKSIIDFYENLIPYWGGRNGELNEIFIIKALTKL